MASSSKSPSVPSSSDLEEEQESASDSEETPAATPQDDAVDGSQEGEDSHSDDDDDDDDDNDDDDDADSVASPNTADFTVRPILRNQPDSPSSKPTVAQPEDENGNDEDDGNLSKRKRALKFDNGAEESEPPIKKGTGAVQRIWSLDDEVVVLEGMVEYKDSKGIDPYGNMVNFYEFIKNRLHIEVSKDQLLGKIRKMKSKFMSKDDEWVLSRPHEQRAFEVSKKIWGEDKLKLNSTKEKKDDGEKNKGKKVDFNSSSGKSKMIGNVILALLVPEASERTQGGTAKKPKVDRKSKEKLKIGRKAEAVKPSLWWMDEVIEFSKKLGNSSFDDRMFREGMKLVAKSESEVLNEKWRKIKEEGAELHLKRLDLIRETTEAIIDN